MKRAFNMFRRKNRPHYYIQDNATGEQRSLKTSDKAQAERLLEAENQAREMPALNLQLGKIFLSNTDPNSAARTWQNAMDKLCTRGIDTSQARYKRELKSSAYDSWIGASEF